MNIKIKNILSRKKKSPIVCLTAYSKNIAKILDKHCDIILVGDSMANVLYGYTNTHKITLLNIIQHTSSVKKGIKNFNPSSDKVIWEQLMWEISSCLNNNAEAKHGTTLSLVWCRDGSFKNIYIFFIFVL